MSHKYNKFIIIFWALVVITIIITSLNPTTHPPSKYNADKLMHFAAYAFMAFLPALVLRSWKVLFITGVFLALVGAGVEVGQTFIPGRSGTIGDGIANTLGVMAGSFVGWKFKKYL